MRTLLNLIVVLCILVAHHTYAQETGTLTDIRDGYVYKTVKIGNQIWFAENLRTNTFRNGDKIAQLITNKEYRKGKYKPGWCYYKNEEENKVKYGYLYTWAASRDDRGLCPEGWRVPYSEDIVELQNYLGGKNVAGRKMKTTTDWKKVKGHTNSSGFSALPSGFRVYSGGFQSINGITYYWTNTRDSSIHRTYVFWLTAGSSGLGLGPILADSAFCVRCIKE